MHLNSTTFLSTGITQLNVCCHHVERRDEIGNCPIRCPISQPKSNQVCPLIWFYLGRLAQKNVTYGVFCRYCWQSYIDFHRCQKIKGEDFAPCEYFKKVYTSMCPIAWVEKWDEQREQGNFPGRIQFVVNVLMNIGLE